MSTQFGIKTNRDVSFGETFVRKQFILGSKRKIKSSTPYCLNINLNAAGTKTKFSTKDYRAKIEDSLNYIGNPVFVSIENEVNNPKWMSGSADDYLGMMAIACAVYGAAKIPVIDGGLVQLPFYGMLYDETGDKNLKKYRNHPQKQLTKDILSGLRELPVFGVNLHYYADTMLTAFYFNDICEYVKIFDKGIHTDNMKVLSNEVGQTVLDANITNFILDTAKQQDMSYLVFYADKGTNSAGLYGVNSKAFQQAIK